MVKSRFISWWHHVRFHQMISTPRRRSLFSPYQKSSHKRSHFLLIFHYNMHYCYWIYLVLEFLLLIAINCFYFSLSSPQYSECLVSPYSKHLFCLYRYVLVLNDVWSVFWLSLSRNVIHSNVSIVSKTVITFSYISFIVNSKQQTLLSCSIFEPIASSSRIKETNIMKWSCKEPIHVNVSSGWIALISCFFFQKFCSKLLTCVCSCLSISDILYMTINNSLKNYGLSLPSAVFPSCFSFSFVSIIHLSPFSSRSESTRNFRAGKFASPDRGKILLKEIILALVH